MVDTSVNRKVLAMILVTLMCTKVSSIDVLTRDFCYTEEWCEPNVWVKTFYYCMHFAMLHPSPVNLNPVYMIKNVSMTPLQLVNFDTLQPGLWTLKNIRNTVAVEFSPGMSVTGANFERMYKILHATFHWGSAVSNGSEHTYNQRRYPMEMQIYSVVSPYTDMTTALYYESGSVLAMAIFIDIGPVDNPLFETISGSLSSIPLAGDQVTVSPFVLGDLLPNDTSKFYKYEGALTYPDCYYVVDWLIFEDPIYISQKQYSRFFTEVYYHDPDEEPPKLLYNNFRPTMTLGSRFVDVSPNASIPLKSSVSGLSANVLAVLSASLVSTLMKWMS